MAGFPSRREAACKGTVRLEPLGTRVKTRSHPEEGADGALSVTYWNADPGAMSTPTVDSPSRTGDGRALTDAEHGPRRFLHYIHATAPPIEECSVKPSTISESAREPARRSLPRQTRLWDDVQCQPHVFIPGQPWAGTVQGTLHGQVQTGRGRQSVNQTGTTLARGVQRTVVCSGWLRDGRFP